MAPPSNRLLRIVLVESEGVARGKMKAESISTPEVRVQEAFDVMLLMISQNVWDILVTQGHGEGVSPGTVLEHAVRAYIDEKGADEARALLARFDGLPVAHREGGEG